MSPPYAADAAPLVVVTHCSTWTSKETSLGSVLMSRHRCWNA